MTQSEIEPKSNSEKTIFSKIKTFASVTLADYIIKYEVLIITTVVSLIALLFFLVIGFPRLFLTLPAFSQRSMGLILLALAFIVTALGVLGKEIDWKDKIFIWLQSNIFTFFTFAYFLRVNAVNLNFLTLNLNTKIIALPLVILIFLINYELFGQNRRKMYLLMPQVFIITLLTFAFISLLGIDRTALRTFSSDWLSSVFTLNDAIWLIVCAISISIVTVLSYKFKGGVKNLWSACLYFIVVWQTIYLINILDITYWYKTLIFLVFWDYFYSPFLIILDEVKDPKYMPKLVISSIYHLGLLLLLLAFSVFTK